MDFVQISQVLPHYIGVQQHGPKRNLYKLLCQIWKPRMICSNEPTQTCSFGGFGTCVVYTSCCC